jgi:hypothetical protein
MENNHKICTSDNDCDNNYMCAFNENDMNHYCISNEKDKLYYGCMNFDNNTKIDSIESNSAIEKQNYKNCIDFSRRQKNSDGIYYNYMIFKPKKNVYLDMTTINIYLKCLDQILAIIPYNDYFTLKCDESQENCILESKESLLNFIVQNSRNCTEKIYLEIIYECENEKLQKHEIVPIDKNNFQPIHISLICPIDSKNDKYKGSCIATQLDKNLLGNENVIDKNKSMYECKTPLYSVPRIIDNKTNYKKVNDKVAKNEMKTYDSKINEKIEDLKRLKAEKYMILQKIQTGNTITYEESYDIINHLSPNKLINHSDEYWKLYENYDAAQYLFDINDDANNNNQNNDKVLSLYGPVYTIEDAKRIATENNQSFFVWYHNSYELDNFASKLYFVNIYAIENDFLDKSNWAHHDNVTTGILKFENFDVNVSQEGGDYEVDMNLTGDDLRMLNKIIEKTVENNRLLKDKYSKFTDKKKNHLDKDINGNVLKSLNDKITTYSQAIKMNAYEDNINNRILKGLGILLLLVFIISIIVLVYFNAVTNGKIKVFSFEYKFPQK